jgi:hypothetical protein
VIAVVVGWIAIAALRRPSEKPPPPPSRYVCNRCNRDDCICEVIEH